MKHSKEGFILVPIEKVLNNFLKHSKEGFVLVPIDKVLNNVAIICKWYYADVRLNTIGVIGHGNKTYCKANKSCDQLTDKNAEYTEHFGFKNTEKENTLPIMY